MVDTSITSGPDELGRPVGLFELDRLRREIETLRGHPVDLVTRAALHPALRDSILAEAIHAA